jgi:hypothetical protein
MGRNAPDTHPIAQVDAVAMPTRCKGSAEPTWHEPSTTIRLLRKMVGMDPEFQIGPNPYTEWTDEDLIRRWNGFERESPAMEVELLKRGYLPLHDGAPNRNLVPGQVNEQTAPEPRSPDPLVTRFQIRNGSHGLALYEGTSAEDALLAFIATKARGEARNVCKTDEDGVAWVSYRGRYGGEVMYRAVPINDETG